MTQVPGLRCFLRLEKHDLDCSKYFRVLLQWIYTKCSLYRVARSVFIHVLFTLVLKGPRCALGCKGVLGSFNSILRLAHTHSCFMSHTSFDSLWVCHCGRATFVRVGQDRRSLETWSSSYAPLSIIISPLLLYSELFYHKLCLETFSIHRSRKLWCLNSI